MKKLLTSGLRLGKPLVKAALVTVTLGHLVQPPHGEYLAGYLIIPTSGRVDSSYNAGFSMYVAVWPLLGTYPGHQFQTGLPGTWMFAQRTDDKLKDVYSDVEGGLGWWRDTRFPTVTPKFIMGGVGPNFSEIANGPAHGAGDWKEPRGLYGVAQLSPWLLFPIDGLNLKQGACGEFLGYGYLNLPLLDPKPTTDGTSVPTGGNCWTLFLNAHNFKGPVAFFTPYFWSHCAAKDPRLAGQLLDTRPMDPNMAIQMETQYIPCEWAKDARGNEYARIAPTSFPLNHGDESALVRQSTAYDKSALYAAVKDWFDGGKACSGQVDAKGAAMRPFPGKGYATWEIRLPREGQPETKIQLDWNSMAAPVAVDSDTHGYRWTGGTRTSVPGHSQLHTLPEYYRLANGDDPKKARWEPIASEEVPAETHLRELQWRRPTEAPQPAYSTPNDPDSCWKKPGPKAGPFKARLGDGTVVTYYWYRFADQPALLNAGLSDSEREQLQKRVEKLHRSWTKDKNYLASLKWGALADLDPAQIVRPPKGLEIGYVPIATRQELNAR